MKRFVCIHGHFYQPPRENPWIEEVEEQDSARPYHDWNERVSAECYGPNTASRMLDAKGRILDIVNNFSYISFNIGPTLFAWLEQHQREYYEAILAADAISRKRFHGHGSAIAQVYNHMIMPLADRRDRQTQVRWGIRDFVSRFGRDPKGMWLPETAVNVESLEVLAEQGIRFTILAPHQAAEFRPIESDLPWKSAADLDTTLPYLVRLPSGQSIAVFFYNGRISQAIAFRDVLASGERFKSMLAGGFGPGNPDEPRLVSVATDGETYGHHHRFGEMALSYCIHLLEEDPSLELTNYAAFLADNPPRHEVRIAENTSWSCSHGVERWRSNCGCATGAHPGWSQAWRRPLREAVNHLVERLNGIADTLGPKLFRDHRSAREHYIDLILDREEKNVHAFLERHCLKDVDPVSALEFLEMIRHGQLVLTSCAWFFDDLDGIETRQVLSYAARAVQLALKVSNTDILPGFLDLLRLGRSNVDGNGDEIFRREVAPKQLDMQRIGAHYAISSTFEDHPRVHDFACFRADTQFRHASRLGSSRLVSGRVTIRSSITWEKDEYLFTVLHAGQYSLTCGLKPLSLGNDFASLEAKMAKHFERGELVDVAGQMHGFFGANIFSLRHLFEDKRRKLVYKLMADSYQEGENCLRAIAQNNQALIGFLKWVGIPAGRLFVFSTEYISNLDLQRLFAHKRVDLDRLRHILHDFSEWPINLDKEFFAVKANAWITQRMHELRRFPFRTELLENLVNVLERLSTLDLQLNLWRAQNTFFQMNSFALELDPKRLTALAADRFPELKKQYLRLGDLLNVVVRPMETE